MSWKYYARVCAGAFGFYMSGVFLSSDVYLELSWPVKLVAAVLFVGTIFGSYELFDRAYEKKLIVRYRPNEAGSKWTTRELDHQYKYIIVDEPSIIDFTLEEK